MSRCWGLSLVALLVVGCASHRRLCEPCPEQVVVSRVVRTAEPVVPPREAVAHVPVAAAADAPDGMLFHDGHLHLTNYVMRGVTMDELLDLVDDRVGRIALFGIPVQQKWDHFVSGDRAPDYYLLSDAPLYYYAFIDAMIAHDYLSLTEERRERIDPLLCGFNPTDMYAPDHIERVLRMYPGVFCGIGEFSIHKEFVSSKVSGHTASVGNPAMDAVFAKAEEIGLLILLHCDVDTVRSGGPRTAHFDDLLRLFADHPKTTIIWAHTGLGRYVAPRENHVALIDEMLSSPACRHVCVDLAWDEVAKWVVESEASAKEWASLIEKHPTRVLFGSDAVAPKEWDGYLSTYRAYEPLWKALTPETRERVLYRNYERVFDEAAARVRAWEARHAEEPVAVGG